MANTGFTWGAWSVLQNAVVLTQGGTVTDLSAAVDLSGKAGCEISVDVTYSNHAKATAGLRVYVCRDKDGTNYEVANDSPWGVEPVFAQNAARARVFSVDPGQIGKFKILLDWGNTTGSSAATVTTRVRTADIAKAT